MQALAARLQQPAARQTEPPADNQVLKDRLAAFGFDASKTAALMKWQELDSKVEAGRITDKDRFREMAQHLWEEADKDRRQGVAPPQKQPAKEGRPEPDRDR